MTRILIYGLNFTPELTGIGKYTGELAQFLHELGHNIRVVTSFPYYPSWRIQDGYPSLSWRYYLENKPNFAVFRCPIWVPKKPNGFKRLIHLISFTVSSFVPMICQIFWKPDIVICVVPTIFSAPTALLTAKLARCSAVLHIQDFELDAAFKLEIIPTVEWVYNIVSDIELFLFTAFDRISTISNPMQDLLFRKGVASDKVILFPNWVDASVIYPLPGPSPFREEWGIPEDIFVVLYSGNIGKKQGLEILIETAKRLAVHEDILFLIVGDGAEKEKLLSQSIDLTNIRFYPLVPAERLNDLLNIADIHVLPQRSGAADLVMPSKLSGMLASGKAVISTADPNTELGRIVQSVGWIVEPENVNDLAETILELSQNLTRCEEAGQKGRNFILEHWSRKTVLKEYSSVIESLSISGDYKSK